MIPQPEQSGFQILLNGRMNRMHSFSLQNCWKVVQTFCENEDIWGEFYLFEKVQMLIIYFSNILAGDV
ncbi:unnamed protein product [Angiostrongylus costaricensis]|uniref:Uncharacterized protein n=1 Tax=Angiostrongylus costaricensis TaxID=334426 RepID=A0A0R3PDS0_ANGCS|nr:unnamed protein product [Angiostrongylus costaricensis]